MIFLSALKSLIYIFLLKNTDSYDIKEANTTVYLSGAAYCGKDKYNTMILKGPATNFITKQILYYKKYDIQGYTGIIESKKTIYVVFRGSSSAKNWIDDFEIKKTAYLTYPECKCNVHSGFYNAATNLKQSVIQSVQSLQNQYKYSNVILTGHSLAASICQLIAMELTAINMKIQLQVYNFGQPRIGDVPYSIFVNKKIQNLWRFTHNKDMVPHTPPMSAIDYYHSCGEVFEDAKGILKTCSNTNCEDPKCADQYELKETNTEDHLYYLSHRVNCEDSII